MTGPAALLEEHTLVVRDGRILDLLPAALADDRYRATLQVERSTHLLLPGLINGYTRLGPAPGVAFRPERLADAAKLRIAAMLRAGTTCFCGVGLDPAESARSAAEQGMRALIGIPISAAPSAWALTPAEYLTRALNFRDEYRGHPSIATAFAPLAPAAITDATFRRVVTLADELDAGIVMTLNESAAAIADCVERHGARPLERLQRLGLLTPALCAVHMVEVTPADLAVAQRGGIAVVLCPQADLLAGRGPAPAAAWAAAGVRLGIGSGAGAADTGVDLWSELRVLALLSRLAARAQTALSAWDAIAAATRGAAAALGLDADIGTLEPGKWADLCCVDLSTPAMQGGFEHPRTAPLEQLVFHGGREQVSDVWVAGRPLLNAGAFTRLDWTDIEARARAMREREGGG